MAEGFVKITEGTRFEQIKPEGMNSALSKVLTQIAFAINGNLDPVSNLKCELVEVTFNAANSQVGVEHGLGRIPQGYFVIKRSASMVIYDGDSQWTKDQVFLKASATGIVSILVF